MNKVVEQLIEQIKNSKTYQLSADIHVKTITEINEWEEDGYSESYSEKSIILNKIYWPGGKYTNYNAN